MLVREFGALEEYRSKYNYLSGLRRRGWAYEHLRRNPHFRQCAYQYQSGFVTETHWEHRVYRLDMLAPQPEAERWGLILFPDPDHTALYADLFWSELAYPNFIRVNVSPRLEGEIDEIYQISAELCRVRQLTDWNGLEHVLVQGKGCAIQVRCTGLSLRSIDPVRMAFELTGPSTMEKQFRLIKQANRAYEPHDPDTPGWTIGSQNLRDGIIALDVIDAGLPLRAAAKIIYGSDRVEESWSSPGQHMKERLRKRLQRARQIRDGGYREYLQKRL